MIHKLRTKLPQFILASLIVLCVYGLMIETGHSHLCQNEIERIFDRIRADIEVDGSKIIAKHVQSGFSEDVWLLSIPANRSVKICLLRQDVDEAHSSMIRELSLPPNRVPDLVAVKISVHDAALGEPPSIHIDSSVSARIVYELSRNERLENELHEPQVSIAGKTPDLFRANWDHYRFRPGPPNLTLNGETLIEYTRATQANGDPIIYGVSLGTDQ